MINTVNISSGTAQTLLEMAGLAVFEPEMYLPEDENKSMKIDNSEENILATGIDINDCIEVYPNPASDELWIEYIIFIDETASEVFVYDIDGRLVHVQKVRGGFGAEQVDISKLSTGSYVLKFGKFTKQFSIAK
ncbi:MAG: T9SS type A sorting domain-containing protein [Bacteroidota bacterium]